MALLPEGQERFIMAVIDAIPQIVSGTFYFEWWPKASLLSISVHKKATKANMYESVSRLHGNHSNL